MFTSRRVAPEVESYVRVAAVTCNAMLSAAEPDELRISLIL